MTNDKPIARGDDTALWARIQLVPFTQKFEGAKQDKTLGDRLRTDSETAGILKWLVYGCLKWQHEGLNPPDEVLQATNEYRQESDKFQNWIDECCVLKQFAVAPTGELYKSFQAWSLANGEKFIVNAKVLANT